MARLIYHFVRAGHIYVKCSKERRAEKEEALISYKKTHLADHGEDSPCCVDQLSDSQPAAGGPGSADLSTAAAG